MIELLGAIGAVSGRISTITGSIELLNFARSLKGSDVISAIFNENGIRTEGSTKIDIEILHLKTREDIWWYTVKEVNEYIFNRIPLITSCVQELAGIVENEKNPSVKYWRWVAMERQGTIVDGTPPANIKVSFIVIGYKPKALMKHFSS